MPFFDSRIFNPETIDAETAALNAKIERDLSALPPIYRFEPRDIRASRAAGNSIWGPIRHVSEAQNRVIPGPAGDIPLRVFIPDEVSGIYLHMRWLAAGNTSELAIYAGGIHAFDAFPIELARRAKTRIREFIRGAIS
jgi:hypothetical protein